MSLNSTLPVFCAPDSAPGKSRALRALHVIRDLSPESGGTTSSVPALVNAVGLTTTYQNTLLTFTTKSGFKPEPGCANTKVELLPWRPTHLYSEVLMPGTIDEWVKSVDIVHIHGLWLAHCVATAAACIRQRKPFVVSAHGMLQPWALHNKRWKKLPYGMLVERPWLKQAACMRALTETEAQDYRQYGLKNPIAIIPNGISIVEEATPEIFLNKYPHLRGRRLVLYLGRIHYKKGVHLLVDAWHQVSQRYPDAALVLAGNDWEGTLATIKDQLRSQQTGSTIEVTGMVTGPLKWSTLAAAHCFCLPSYSEGFSVAVLEALASSVPVIVTPGCNFPEIAVHNAGWVVEPQLPTLIDALERSLNQPVAERKAMGERARALVHNHYQWPSLGRGLAETYDWILGGPKPKSTVILT